MNISPTALEPPSASADLAWDALARAAGSPFHSREFSRALEAHWPGTLEPRHIVWGANGRCDGLVLAYLSTACPRLDYLRTASQGGFHEPVLLSHALIGWYGYPLACTSETLHHTIDAFCASALGEGAVALFAGIDERDVVTLDALMARGFALSHVHTLMIRALDPDEDQDPLARLRGRYRRSRGQKVRRALEAGTTCRCGGAADVDAAIDLLLASVTSQGLTSDVLPESFVRGILTDPLPGTELLIAEDRDGVPIGVNVNVVWSDRYFVWLGGYRRECLNTSCQSDLLYYTSIRRAAALRCREIQIGRASYTPKFEFGYSPVRLIAAARGATPSQHTAAAAWIDALAARHTRNYPELHAALSANPWRQPQRDGVS